MNQDKSGRVIVLGEDEQIVHDPRVPAENIGHPVHDWKSKAVEQFHLAQRRRRIIRKLVGKCAKAKSAGCDFRGF